MRRLLRSTPRLLAVVVTVLCSSCQPTVLALDGPAWPWVPTFVLAALILPGAAVVAAVVLRRRRGAECEPLALARTP
jgi:hypothetical protein